MGALVNKLRTGKGDKVTVNLYHGALWAGGIGIVATQFGSPYPKSRTSVHRRSTTRTRLRTTSGSTHLPAEP